MKFYGILKTSEQVLPKQLEIDDSVVQKGPQQEFISRNLIHF